MWGIVTLVFMVMNVVPRDTAAAMLGSMATQEDIEKFNERWGLDKPIWQRYFEHFYYLSKGNLGTSIRTGRPVIKEVINYFPATFELATFSIVISFIVGVLIGVISAVKRNKFVDQVTRFLSLVGVSTPNFWLGLLILLVLYLHLGFASPGRITSAELEPIRITGFFLIDSIIACDWDSLFDSFKHLLGPSLALGFFGIGVIARLTRSSMLDVLNKDYIKAARSRGLSSFRVIRKHALKNSLAPAITILGYLYGAYLGGALIIENVFSWPGLGYFAYLSIIKADSPAILGVVLIIAFIRSFVNLIVDIIYRFLDPRIEFK